MPDHLPFRIKSGRPSTVESQSRTREFVRLLTDGVGWREAQRQSRIAPATVCKLLDDPAFQPVARAVLEAEAA